MPPKGRQPAPPPTEQPPATPKGKEASVSTSATPMPTDRPSSPTPSVDPSVTSTLSRSELAKLISAQVALALAAHKAESFQPQLSMEPTPAPQTRSHESIPPPRARQGTVLTTVEELDPQQLRPQDGPRRGTEAQELSDGVDPSFDAWRLQVLARFRDDPHWYHSDERKLDYMLRRTRGDAQVHMIAGMKDELLPGYFWTAQDAMNSLRQALVNPQAKREAQNLFRVLSMGNSEAFAQFRTRFLLLAHQSHLRAEDYRDELWHKITPTLATAVAAVEAQMVTYDELAECLLATDINLRWLKPRTTSQINSSARRDRNATGQFVPERVPVALGRSFHASSPLPSFSPAAVPNRASVTPHRRSATPALNPDHAGDTCYNCGKIGHRSPACPQPRATAELKELSEQLDSGAESDDQSAETGKDSL